MPDAVQTIHRVTSYAPPWETWDQPFDHPDAVTDIVSNDLATIPDACKSYADGLPVVALPREWPVPGAPMLATLAGSSAPAAAVDLAALGRLFHLSAGVVRSRVKDGHRYLFRAAGSAGGRFPLELYVSSCGVAGLPDGVHWYDPVGHALRQIGPAAIGGVTTLIATGIPWRTGWRYLERGFRHIYWDGGTLLAQAQAVATSGGLDPRVFTSFDDAAIARLVGADGIHEFPIWLMALGWTNGDSPRPSTTAVAGSVDRAPREFPLVTAAQHAGDRTALGAEQFTAAAFEYDVPESPPVDDVILTRGSTRVFDATASVPRATLETAMALGLRGIDVPHFIAVHAVDGLEAGIYRWPDLDTPIRTGNLREELFFVALDQELPRDAAFVVIGAARTTDLDPHEYREAQLAAGLVEGRLHLAAYAAAIGASGMTFFDSEIPKLVGEDIDGLIFTCVGVPTYRSKPGGRPGAATEIVRLPTPAS